MATSDIAIVVADVVNKRFRTQGHATPILNMAKEFIDKPVIVNATAVYQGIQDKNSINLYEDHPCVAPPWDEFAICYENKHGNVIIMHANAFDRRIINKNPMPWQSLADDHVIEWDRVRWEIDTFIYAGGRSARGPVQTTGPIMLWRYAVYEDGSAADLYWMNLWDSDPDSLVKKGLDFANFVMMGALNLLNCKNIQIVDPPRERAERRRIDRTGVKLHEINVYPMGRRSTYTKVEPSQGVPFSPVRGYFATYTEERPLFGKYPGRFWIPQHARGKREFGERNNPYRLRPRRANRPDSGDPEGHNPS
jgi:hypothetical protein